MSNFAAIFDVDDTVTSNDSYEDNFFGGGNNPVWLTDWLPVYVMDQTVLDGAASSFAFGINSYYRPNAAVISKITVQL